MGKYVRKLEEVEAVRATETNWEELKEFAGVRVNYYHHTLGKPFYYVEGHGRMLVVGYYMVKHEDGRVQIMTEEEFDDMYEPK